jgi:hypothetical protein
LRGFINVNFNKIVDEPFAIGFRNCPKGLNRNNLRFHRRGKCTAKNKTLKGFNNLSTHLSMIVFNHFVVVDFVDRPHPAFHAGLLTSDPFGIQHSENVVERFDENKFYKR